MPKAIKKKAAPVPMAFSASVLNNKNNSLNFGSFNGIINMDEELKELYMRKKLELAEQIHPKEISYSEKSGWFTDVPDSTRPEGRRKIRKSTKEKVLEALAEYYFDNNQQPQNLSLADVYKLWISWKDTGKNTSNIKRLEMSWKTYYQNEPLSAAIISKPMNTLTSLELRTWAENLLKKHGPVDRKKFSRMFQIIKECYEYAADEDRHIVDADLWIRAKKKINPALMVPITTPTDESQVFTDEERKKIKDIVYADLERLKHQPTSAGLQILFMFQCALRIGECCGLKWSDLKDGQLHIQRQADNNSVKEWTKTTNGYRVIPLTQEALKILDDVKKYNEEHGFNAEWIFQSDNPNYDYRLSYNAANNKLAKICKQIGTEYKSSHKIRKTALSILMDSTEISKRTVQRFAGHGDISTTQRYYSFERRSREEQAKAIDSALAL